ncbi:hypothetical protein ACFU8I_18445 [Streptomyces sp. NPDC057540]|uniref:hypothetical protein n=1 Tax=Streptomyces sp. NPDC057540 TaxID=3346160 RepID=UPI0036A05CE2
MSVEHAHDGRILAVTLPPDLDVASRGAVALHVERLVLAYRPRGVRLHMPSGHATGASLSVLARALRLCEHLGIALTLTDRPWAPHTPPAHADRPAVAGS